ncbi:class I SAM-dependent methyltransferase [Crocosphaera sp.]|uniref:class I SAM-dependent methyltransferase n=1 Tax=Crocosphaera sp. TaxID=2729996 RepID=UPI003F26566A
MSRRVALFLLTPLFLFLTRKAHGQEEPQTPEGEWIKINSRVSLVHLGSIDSFDKTAAGIAAAKLMLDALENNNLKSAKEAVLTYEKIIPNENFGGEYTALQWFGEYLLASPQQQQQFLKEPLVLEFFNFFADNDFANLKEYLKRKYEIEELEDDGSEEATERERFLEDFILFNNPRREEWEQTSKMLDSLNVQPGYNVADIGCGPGYYTFKFSKLVGSQGKVLAVDTVENHLNYVKNISEKYGVNNIELVNNTTDNAKLPPQQMDLIYMCSLYHIIYSTSLEPVKDRFVESIKQALKKEGRLIVVDNGVVEDQTLPYHGPYIAKELIINQLKYYGFRLIDQYGFIPQRYVLVFQVG